MVHKDILQQQPATYTYTCRLIAMLYAKNIVNADGQKGTERD